MYWSEAPAFIPPPVQSLQDPPTFNSKRSRRDTASPTSPPPPSLIERKHVFLYSAITLPMSDEPSSPDPNALTMANAIALKQNALAALRRKMSYGKAEAKAQLQARRKQSVGADNAGPALGLDLGSPLSPEAGTGSGMTSPPVWVSKTFMFHLPLQTSDNALPPSIDLKAEAAEHEKSKTKLVEGVRVAYKLVARYESGLLSLWNRLALVAFTPDLDWLETELHFNRSTLPCHV